MIQKSIQQLRQISFYEWERGLAVKRYRKINVTILRFAGWILINFLNIMCENQLRLPIIKRHLRTEIGNSIVQRRKVKYQLKVFQIEKLKISLNRARQDRHFFSSKFFEFDH